MLGKPCKARPRNEEMRISNRKGAIKGELVFGEIKGERPRNPKRPGG